MEGRAIPKAILAKLVARMARMAFGYDKNWIAL